MPQKANRKKPKKKTSKQKKPESDQKKIEQPIDKIPKEAVEKLLQPTLSEIERKFEQVHVKREISSGPLPAPKILEEYEKICIGAADRIVKMAEEESQHRHKMEEKALSAEIEFNNKSLQIEGREILLGQFLGFSIAAIITLCGSYVALNGSQVSGTIISSTGAVGLVTAFIYGRTGAQNKKSKRDDGSDDKK